MEELKLYLRAVHGRSSALAVALGITPGAISQWDRVPAERVLEVEKATGIPRQVLRPDVYGPPDTGPPSSEEAA
jgi:DNA-binding transcriptional regulator YdaS (Cro superfamily)